MRRSVAGCLVLTAIVSTAAGCRDPGTDPGAADAVIARFSDGEITAAQMDARLLALPVSERPKPGENLGRWYEDQVREAVIARRLLAAARHRGLRDDEAFRAARHEAEKQIGLQLCLRELVPDADAITESDLRAAFEEHADELSAPERRSVFQLFLRRDPGVRERIEALRDRVLAGEGFSHLAAEHSQSETRHRRGFLGWVHPGRLPTGFEEVIFGLEEGVPSAPVETREGFHLFYVDQVLPARSPTLDEARPLLRRRLEAERQETALADLDAAVEPPRDSLVLDRDDFAAVNEAGDPAAPVLRMGDEAWTLGDLRREVQVFMARQDGPGGAPTLELAWRILDQARRREEIHRHCRSDDRIPASALARRIDAWERRALADAERHRRLVALASKDESRLRLFYESNVGDFSAPPTWEIHRLHVPLGELPVTVMERLEAAAAIPGTRLGTLQRELGGEIEELEPMSLADLGRLQPKLPALVAPLEAGRLSAPYRTESGLEIVEVMTRTPSKPIPFEQVRDRIATRYVAQYTAELYDELSEQMLREVDLRIDPNALAQLREAGLPRPDVSVDQLEALLARQESL